MLSQHLRRIELSLLILGLLLIGVFVGAHIHRATQSSAALTRFKELKQEQANRPARSFAGRTFTHDFSLWSPQRVARYRQSLTQNIDSPLAILRIQKVKLEVPVLNGTDELSLNRGVGYIPGMSRPGEPGNVGIAGHRDGFFRVLKDLVPGDIIEVETLDRVYLYKIDQIAKVDKNDNSILRQTSEPLLTLVTCYPFYFIGSAPKRYIVVASLVTSGVPTLEPLARSARLEPVSQTSKPQSHKPIKETRP